MFLWFSHGYLISLVGITLCDTHTYTHAHAMSACVPGQAALASEVERGASGESGEMDHCQGPREELWDLQ